MHELNERQQKIVERLESEGEIKINELKLLFDVTEMTIRRDLEKLEQAGFARRTFGGAIFIGKDVALKVRTGIQVEEKIKIGRKAASLIQPGDSIFIDGGTTTFEIARSIKPRMDITVVTNALNVAHELLDKKIPTIVAGGMAMEATATLIGPIAASTIASLAFDRVFLGATGLTASHGFSNSNAHETEIKKLAISKAAEVNIVIDHTKFGAKELFSFARLGQVHRLITDRLPENELKEACQSAGISVIEA
ncbi:DeoR/GlpR family DNA-binding transcription regulator [Cohnella terricola]|uniref:DeoR/GlpR transcriptional regulator n=1 Tax=Cohnella terricola TaxID=1289167 RepID=A0A559JGP5_9BACL|nr:DeoR/GlpR family DNA-binding transcription regulator [Cohnella terricola]TVX99046.1 DeoR/GlpR transcriptional regulator [Cohnella terricola]